MQKKKKKLGLRGAATTFLVLAAVVYLVVALVDGQMKLAGLRDTLDGIEQETQVQADRNSSLQALLDAGDRDAFVERIARERYGYVRPGERVYVDMTGQ